ncbi:redoxin domain-containing protein [Rhabdothermincola salaria]|uniref:redoxin domain-containing protein n=1 Tax=Rhabdothermincola salaria TaxID=2903142 RepID=UPI001E5836BB|nr:redoxin domain-containing protein [Rhabdothermincola salaria]MCD9624257.1 redoxin domain-containing protein [Rhabdothermincola salaria]
MWIRALAVVFGFGLVAAACGGSSSDGGAQGPSGAGDAAAPGFTAATVSGGEFDSASLEGAPSVLWFWAPWCTSCRAEAPDVVAAAEAFDGRVQVVGVAGRGEIPAMEGFVADTGTGALEHVVDADGSIWSDYGVFAQPAFAFVGASGEVEVFVGTMGEDALVERMTSLADAT